MENIKHYVVVCALIKKDDRYFVCQRGSGRALEGYYEFPGGKIENGETNEEALVREIKEELDSVIKVNRYVGVSEYTYLDVAPFKPFKITLIAYECELLEGKLTLSEHQSSLWLTKEEMLSVNFAPADIPLIKML